MKFSWTRLQTYLGCPRRFELSYLNRLEPVKSADDRSLFLGSAFHKGIEAALSASFSGGDVTAQVSNARKAAKAYISDNTPANKLHFDGTNHVLDYDYYAMVNEVDYQVGQLLAYHIPKMEIGKRWRVPSLSEVIKDGATDKPATEIEVEMPLYFDDSLTGVIDAVLFDNYTHEYVIVDWKTRISFPFEDVALLDGQLHLYSAILASLGTDVSRVVMWQFKTKLPSPASISTRNNLPNTGAASYDTTWEVWCATLPAGIDPEDYREIMMPKLKRDEDFTSIVEGAVTPTSRKMALDNALDTIDLVRHSIGRYDALSGSFPAVLSSNVCKFCPFQRLCSSVLRYGGSADEIISQYYTYKESVD